MLRIYNCTKRYHHPLLVCVRRFSTNTPLNQQNNNQTNNNQNTNNTQENKQTDKTKYSHLFAQPHVKEIIDRIVRVDQAGEFGAARMYL